MEVKLKRKEINMVRLDDSNHNKVKSKRKRKPQETLELHCINM
jgi:hypothetical protein